MKAIIFDTKEEAEDFSRLEAEKRGCTDGTKFWYPTTTLNDGSHALLIKDTEVIKDEANKEIETVPVTDQLLKVEEMYSIKK